MRMDLQVRHQALLTLEFSFSANHGAPGNDHYFLADLHLMPSSRCHMEKHITKWEAASRSHRAPSCWKHIPAEPKERAWKLEKGKWLSPSFLRCLLLSYVVFIAYKTKSNLDCLGLVQKLNLHWPNITLKQKQKLSQKCMPLKSMCSNNIVSKSM